MFFQLLFHALKKNVYGFLETSRGLRTDHKRVMDIETKCCSVTQTRIVMILSKKKNDKNVLLRRQVSL